MSINSIRLLYIFLFNLHSCDVNVFTYMQLYLKYFYLFSTRSCIPFSSYLYLKTVKHYITRNNIRKFIYFNIYTTEVCSCEIFKIYLCLRFVNIPSAYTISKAMHHTQTYGSRHTDLTQTMCLQLKMNFVIIAVGLL